MQLWAQRVLVHVAGMGKKSRAPAVKSKEVSSAPSGAQASQSEAPLRAELLALSSLLYGVRLLGRQPALFSEAEGRCHFVLRFMLFGVMEGVLRAPCLRVLMPASRALARRLPGAVVPSEEALAEKEEEQQHDPSLTWPVAMALERIPAAWRAIAAKAGKQPYFLNHVRGCVRIRQAASRLASALATVMQVAVMSWLIDHRLLSEMGAQLSAIDLALGTAVGAGIVVVLFSAEVAVGWLCVVCRSGEVVVAGESLWLNLLWDALFHVGVAINEELSLRGWVLVNTAHACVAHFGASPVTAMSLAVSLQASLFALYHVGSPGATRVGLFNLVVGGICAALNVFLTGGLSFALGWHFGWNITMGHVLGLSTSGIPMSAKLVSVIPHPQKAHLHGGRFGPEQSPLAVPTYLLGVVMLLMLYGTDGLDVWRARLAPAPPSK